jgi:Rhomboid family
MHDGQSRLRMKTSGELLFKTQVARNNNVIIDGFLWPRLRRLPNFPYLTGIILALSWIFLPDDALLSDIPKFAINQILHVSLGHFYGNVIGFVILGGLVEVWIFRPWKMRYLLYTLCFCAGYPSSLFFWYLWGYPAVGLSSMISAFFGCLVLDFRKQHARLRAENSYLYVACIVGVVYGFGFLITPFLTPTGRFYVTSRGGDFELHLISLAFGVFSYLLLHRLLRMRVLKESWISSLAPKDSLPFLLISRKTKYSIQNSKCEARNSKILRANLIQLVNGLQFSQRNLLSSIVVVLVLLVLVTHDASGQFGGTVQITQVNAPSTVAAGQSLTVIITVSYSLLSGVGLGQYVVVAVLDHTGTMGKPYPITGSSCEGYQYPNESICSITPSDAQGHLSVGFTLTAPQAQFFYLCVYAYAMNSWNNQVAGSDSKVAKVVTSSSVPEFPIPVLPMFIAFLTLPLVIVRKSAKGKIS